MIIIKKETTTMDVEKATVLLVLKRLALSKTTYKLIGTLLVALGVLNGSDVMNMVSDLVCVASGGCVE